MSGLGGPEMTGVDCGGPWDIIGGRLDRPKAARRYGKSSMVVPGPRCTCWVVMGVSAGWLTLMSLKGWLSCVSWHGESPAAILVHHSVGNAMPLH